jgi:hypothetical protein
MTVLAASLAGCSAGTAPEAGSAPPIPAAPDASAAPSAIVTGSSDSVSVRPGSPAAQYRYRIKQVEPASDKFQFQDRDLSFYMRPTPAAVHFQVENRQDRPVLIDWDRSTFVDPYGRTAKIAHATTRWADRYGSQAQTTIPGLQRYSDYCFSGDFLVEPGGSDDQLHRPLLPEDASAPQFNEAVFGMDLVFIVEGQPRTYTFRFKVASILPR